jgi:hypothetical protein
MILGSEVAKEMLEKGNKQEGKLYKVSGQNIIKPTQ